MASIQLRTIRDEIFPAVFKGRYDDGSSGNFLPLSKRTSLYHFQYSEKIPSLGHVSYMLRNSSGVVSTAVFNATSGVVSHV